MVKRGKRGIGRKAKKKQQNKSQAHFSLVGYFLQEMYPLMVELEKDGRIAIDHHLPGVVMNHEIGALYLTCITEHVMQLRKRLGNIKRVVDAFEHVKGFREKHNPYQELATFIQWCKMMCAMRIGAEAGEKGIKLEYNPNHKFFIAIMKEDLTEPSHTGFELNGQILLEAYIPEAEEVNEEPTTADPSDN